MAIGQHGNRVQERLDLERLASDLSGQFAQVSLSKVDPAINEALGCISMFFRCDCCGLSAVQHNSCWASSTHVSSAGGSPAIRGGINVPEMLPSMYEYVVLKGQTHQLVSAEDLSPEVRVEAQSWRALVIRSAFHVPLRSASGIHRLIALNMLRKQRRWPGRYRLSRQGRSEPDPHSQKKAAQPSPAID